MTSKGKLRRNTLCLIAVSTVLCNAALAAQSDNEKKEEHLYLSEQYLYDDNLFRDAETTDGNVIPGSPIDPNANAREVSREDYVNRITVGVGNDFHMGQQTLRLKGRVYDARYQNNDYLDYTGGDASAAFDFRALTALSGRLSSSYGRQLADFANTLGTDRDIIETMNHSALVRWAVGPRWSVSAGGGRIETEHSLARREAENLEANLGRVSIDYATPVVPLVRHRVPLSRRKVSERDRRSRRQRVEQRLRRKRRAGPLHLYRHRSHAVSFERRLHRTRACRQSPRQLFGRHLAGGGRLETAREILDAVRRLERAEGVYRR
jgi:hypothetical protein